MTYADMLRELLAQSGMTEAEYADHIGIRREHFNAILNGREPGSLKTFLQALKAENLDLPQWLSRLFHTDSTTSLLIRKLLWILNNDPRGRDGITVNIEYIYEQSVREVKRRQKEIRSSQQESESEVLKGKELDLGKKSARDSPASVGKRRRA